MISIYKYKNFFALDILSKIESHTCLNIIVDNEHFKDSNAAKYIDDIYKTIYYTYMQHNVKKINLIQTFPLNMFNQPNCKNIYKFLQKLRYGNKENSCSLALLSKLIEATDHSMNNVILLFTFNNGTVMDLIYNQLVECKNIKFMLCDLFNYKLQKSSKNQYRKMTINNGIYMEQAELNISEDRELLLVEKVNDKDELSIDMHNEDGTMIHYDVPNAHILPLDESNVLNYLVFVHEKITNDFTIHKNISVGKYINILENIEQSDQIDTRLKNKIKKKLELHEINIIQEKLDIDDDIYRKIKNSNGGKIPYNIKKKILNKISMNKEKMISPKDMYIICDKIKNEIDKFDQMSDSHKKSTDFFHSLISVSDWYEELSEGSGFGLLIKLNTSISGKIFMHDGALNINEITTTFISVRDYLDSVAFQIDNNGKIDFGNMDVFSGNGIGSSNAILPLFINKYHWEQIKQQIPYVYGIIYSHNPYGYSDHHDNYIFYIFMDICRRTFVANTNLSEKWIHIFIAVYRTCSQVGYEKGYTRGIKNFIKNVLEVDINKVNLEKMYMLMGQIVSTGTNIDNVLDKLCDTIYYSYIKKKIAKKYDPKYVDHLFSLVKQDPISGEICKIYGETEFAEEINEFIKYVCDETIYMAEMVVSFKNVYKIMKKFILDKFFGSYRKMIFSIDDNFGLLPDNGCIEFLMTNISNNTTKNMSCIDFVVSKICGGDRYKLFYITMNLLNGSLYNNYGGQTYEETVIELINNRDKKD